MWILVLLGAVAGGTGLASLFDEDAPLPARIATGIPLGIALLGLVGFTLASFLGLTPLSIGAATLAVAAPALVAGWPGRLPQRRLPQRRLRPARLIRQAACALAMLALWRVFDRAMFEAPGGVYVGNDHSLGDLPFHLSVITSFAKAANFPPEHPELLGARLTYPFLADFVAAMLVRAGAGLREAVVAEDVILAVALALLLHRFGLRLTRDGRAAVLTPILVLLSGGLGFLRVVGDARRSGHGVWGVLASLPHDYTITFDGDLRWGNTLVALLVPQRSLLLGLPLVLVVWTLWWRAIEGGVEGKRPMLAAGAIAGLLPLAHAHAFAVVLGLGVCLCLLFRRCAAWPWFFAAALLGAAPQVVWLASGSSLQAGGFLAWQPGWDSAGRNPLGFWLVNAGLYLPLLAVAFWRCGTRRMARFCLPFLLLFLVPNLWRLSPWIWDNIKFLVFWYVGCAPLVAWLLARLSRAGRLGTLAAVALFVSLTLSGALDVWRMVSGQIANRIFDKDGVAFASYLLDRTPPRSVVLHAPTYDSPVYLSGRRSVLGYPGHIPSQGLTGVEREEEIARIYAGGAGADALLDRYRVDYIVVGPQERSHLTLNEPFLERHRLVGAVGAYRLLEVRRR